MCLITTVDLLRHGAVQGGNYYRGSTDDLLTAEGWQQMRVWSKRQQGWTQIMSSPLCRCVDFAQELSAELQLPLYIEPRFQEIHFGDWEGKTATEIEQTQPQVLQRFYQDPLHNAPPQGETAIAFAQRVNAAWQDLLTTSRGETILLVTHAGVIRSLFCQLLKIPLAQSFAVTVDYASLSRFCCYHAEDGDFVQLKFHKSIDL
jgi:alpha-ribazole phosphatase